MRSEVAIDGTRRILTMSLALGVAGVTNCAPSPTPGGPSRAAPPIVVDGAVGDWQALLPLHQDPQAIPSTGVDFGRLWATNDDHSLLLRFEVGAEFTIQDQNDIVLYLDTDADVRTGMAVHGIGAELEWAFGRRAGRYFLAADTVAIEHQQVGLISAPTVSAREFEVLLDRDAKPVGNAQLFPAERIRMVLADEVTSGDRLPDGDGGVVYTFDTMRHARVIPLTLEKRDPAHVRVLSYNVNNRLFRSGRGDAYRRILAALAPDVLVFQEVRDHLSGQVVDYVAPMLGRSVDQWHHARVGGEATVVMSPYPILASFPLGESGAVLLDLSDTHGTSLLLIGLSAPCCGNNAARQREMDLIMSFVRDAKEPGGEVDVEFGTPILLIGDANLVGHARQRETLLNGRISDSVGFGSPFFPDWDGTAFTDLIPRHTHRPLTFTWFGREFSPGRLDYAIYSDAVMGIGNRFVLYTPHMPAPELAIHDLRLDDVLRASNHLPLVADLVLRDDE